MGKGGIVLGMIALLLGASGLGLGVITYINQGNIQINQEITQVIRLPPEFWYVYKEDIFTPTSGVYINVPDLYVIVYLDVAATVHLLFTTSTRILPDPFSFADMLFYFWIDGVRLTNPFTRAGPFEGDATYQYYPVALQHSQALTAGFHNISITVFSETAGNLMRSSGLAVTRY
ncbi:MAG: hypothetical protein ACFFBY_10825 [Promethearchaeota archaeon]